MGVVTPPSPSAPTGFFFCRSSQESTSLPSLRALMRLLRGGGLFWGALLVGTTADSGRDSFMFSHTARPLWTLCWLPPPCPGPHGQLFYGLCRPMKSTSGLGDAPFCVAWVGKGSCSALAGVPEHEGSELVRGVGSQKTLSHQVPWHSPGEKSASSAQ